MSLAAARNTGPLGKLQSDADALKIKVRFTAKQQKSKYKIISTFTDRFAAIQKT